MHSKKRKGPATPSASRWRVWCGRALKRDFRAFSVVLFTRGSVTQDFWQRLIQRSQIFREETVSQENICNISGACDTDVHAHETKPVAGFFFVFFADKNLSSLHVCACWPLAKVRTFFWWKDLAKKKILDPHLEKQVAQLNLFQNDCCLYNHGLGWVKGAESKIFRLVGARLVNLQLLSRNDLSWFLSVRKPGAWK